MLLSKMLRQGRWIIITITFLPQQLPAQFTFHPGKNVIPIYWFNCTAGNLESLSLHVKPGYPSWLVPKEEMQVEVLKPISSEGPNGVVSIIAHEFQFEVKEGFSNEIRVEFEIYLGKVLLSTLPLRLVYDNSTDRTSSERGPKIPIDYVLGQNYPNPFNTQTTIPFSLPQEQEVSLYITNALAQQVRMIFNGSLPAGTYQFCWDGRDQQGQEVATGLYFYTLKTKVFSDTKTLLFLK